MKIYLNEDNPRFELEKDDFVELARICVLRNCIPVCEMLSNACNLQNPKSIDKAYSIALEQIYTVLNDSQYEPTQIRNTHYLLNDWYSSTHRKYSDYRIQRSCNTRKMYVLSTVFPGGVVPDFNLGFASNIQSSSTTELLEAASRVDVTVIFNRPVTIDLIALMFKKKSDVNLHRTICTIWRYFNSNWFRESYRWMLWKGEVGIRRDELTASFASHYNARSSKDLVKSRYWEFRIDDVNINPQDIISNLSLWLVSSGADRPAVGGEEYV